MKKFLFTMLTFAIIIGTGIVHAAAPEGWTTDFDKALAEAKAAKKHVFVLFTGSDWCGWCVKLRKNVLDNKKFKKFAKENLVLLYDTVPAGMAHDTGLNGKLMDCHGNIVAQKINS